jgi:hypothetical protein
MTNVVKERDLNPTRTDKFHWTALNKETSDDGFVNKANTSNMENLYMCCVRLFLTHLTKTQRE